MIRFNKLLLKGKNIYGMLLALKSKIMIQRDPKSKLNLKKYTLMNLTKMENKEGINYLMNGWSGGFDGAGADKGQYLFGVHPHGIHCYPILTFMTPNSDFYQQFNGKTDTITGVG